LSREKEELRNQKLPKRFFKRLVPSLYLLQAKSITGGEIRRFGRKDNSCYIEDKIRPPFCF
jgi:hypothetical protein